MLYDWALGYIIGTLNGDGSLFKSIDYHYFDQKGRQVPKAKSVRRVPRYRYTFALHVLDKDFADMFAQCLQIVTVKKPCQWTTKKNEFKVILTNKEWYGRIIGYKNHPEWIKYADIEEKRGFLRGMFDSEGSIQKRDYGKRIILYNKDRQLLILCQVLLLTDFNIYSFFQDESNIKGANCSRITFGSKENIEKFHQEISFSIQRKRDILEL